jgi:hypothetical protein
VGWDFHRASLTCPQIKRRSHIARDPAPTQGTEASPPDKGTHKNAVGRPTTANRSAASETKYVMVTFDCKRRATARSAKGRARARVRPRVRRT